MTLHEAARTVSEMDKSSGQVDNPNFGIAEIQNHRNGLRREFKSRHVSMFALACAVGTGLVISSGTGLAEGGPASLLISFILIGTTVLFVMTALGEMAAYLPMDKGFGGYATRMIDPAFGYATGWNYFFKYIINIPTNLTAAGLIVSYWRPDLNVTIWITVFGIVVIVVNIFHVKYFGEIEFWLGSIKIPTMAALILTCFIISMGGTGTHERIGFRYWSSPGAFAPYLLTRNKALFLGWWANMSRACFAYTGTEVVGIAFGEMPDPKKNIPRAVKQTFWRIACFYILGVLVLGMSVPYNSPALLAANGASTSAAASPFVVAISLAGIDVYPDIINAALLVFVVSAASTDIYTASRCIYGLATDGQAPIILSKTSQQRGIPIYAVALSSIFALLGYMNATNSAATVFEYFVSLVTVFAVLNWLAILLSYFAFRCGLRAQGVSLDTLPYIGFLQPYGACYSLFVTCVVILFNGYNAFIPSFTASTFVLNYLGLVLFVVNFLFWKIFKRTVRVRANTMDLLTGRQESSDIIEASV